MKDFIDIDCSNLHELLFEKQGNIQGIVNVKIQNISQRPFISSQSLADIAVSEKETCQDWASRFAIASIAQYSAAMRTQVLGIGCLIAWYREPNTVEMKEDTAFRQSDTVEYERLAKSSPLTQVFIIPPIHPFRREDWMIDDEDEPVWKYAGLGESGEKVLCAYRFNQLAIPTRIREGKNVLLSLHETAIEVDACALAYLAETQGMRDFIAVRKGLHVFYANNGVVQYAAAQTPAELYELARKGMRQHGVLEKKDTLLCWTAEGTHELVDFSSCLVPTERDFVEG